MRKRLGPGTVIHQSGTCAALMGQDKDHLVFNFLHRSAPRYPTIRQTLVNAGLLSSTDPDALTVLERHGSYSGRRVNFFRAFNPTHATAGAIRIQAFADLDGHRELVLGSGHVEQQGMVVEAQRYRRRQEEATSPSSSGCFKRRRMSMQQQEDMVMEEQRSRRRQDEAM